MKRCSYCKTIKEDTEFVKGAMCRSCKVVYDKQYYLKNKERLDAHAKAYGKTEKGYQVNRKATAKYRNTVKGKQIFIDAHAKLKADPMRYADDLWKRRARNAVHYAVKTGKLVKGCCEVCGSPEVHAHHDDYNKKLDVRWLCTLHHGVLRKIDMEVA